MAHREQLGLCALQAHVEAARRERARGHPTLRTAWGSLQPAADARAVVDVGTGQERCVVLHGLEADDAQLLLLLVRSYRRGRARGHVAHHSVRAHHDVRAGRPAAGMETDKSPAQRGGYRGQKKYFAYEKYPTNATPGTCSRLLSVARDRVGHAPREDDLHELEPLGQRRAVVHELLPLVQHALVVARHELRRGAHVPRVQRDGLGWALPRAHRGVVVHKVERPCSLGRCHLMRARVTDERWGRVRPRGRIRPRGGLGVGIARGGVTSICRLRLSSLS